ncbi:Uncharacterised protein [Vibrio cholerae]|nr:Uncharacterised protein [Vibrio cholerae]
MGKRTTVMKRNDFHSRERFSPLSTLLTSLIHLPTLFAEISATLIFQSGDKSSLIKANVRPYI